ncbi:MAG: 2-isopropylmalate synthase [Candidatus Aenigmatarchaeota archaeon]
MPEKVCIFDTTLRDGEQASAVGSLGALEKYSIAQLLEQVGVDVIEAGFPASSGGDFDAVRYVAGRISRSEVAALARAVEKDIDSAYDAVKDAKRPRIHTFIAVSPIHMEKKLGKSPDEVRKMAISAVRFARQKLGSKGKVEFSGEDSFRAEPAFLKRIYEDVIEAGANVINVPDTVGYAQPDEVRKMFEYLRASVKGGDRVMWSFHGHNDLGNATANAMAAITGGARQIECTINGVGERAGNTAMEEVLANLRTRKAYYSAESGVDTTQIGRISRHVSRLLGMPVQPNKAVVGANAFAHSSGIHQDGVCKERLTYELMKPEEWGWDSKGVFVITARSGGKGIKKALEDMGYRVTEEEARHMQKIVKPLADSKGKLSDIDLAAILEDEVRKPPEVVALKSAYAAGGSSTRIGYVELVKEGAIVTKTATGNGPIDALYNAINGALGIETQLLAFNIAAIGRGKEALGEVTVAIADDGNRYVGRGVSTDIIDASAKAYMHAINKMLYGRLKR